MVGELKTDFYLQKKALNSKVDDKNIDVMDISKENIGEHDLVLLLGVLYHLKYPLKAMEIVSSVTKKMLVLETLTDFTNINRPAAAFYPDAQLDGDNTNWWGFNPSAIEHILRHVGFKKIKKVYSHPYWFRFGRAVKLKTRNKSGFFNSLSQSRVVYHAWK